MKQSVVIDLVKNALIGLLVIVPMSGLSTDVLAQSAPPVPQGPNVTRSGQASSSMMQPIPGRLMYTNNILPTQGQQPSLSAQGRAPARTSSHIAALPHGASHDAQAPVKSQPLRGQSGHVVIVAPGRMHQHIHTAGKTAGFPANFGLLEMSTGSAGSGGSLDTASWWSVGLDFGWKLLIVLVLLYASARAWRFLMSPSHMGNKIGRSGNGRRNASIELRILSTIALAPRRTLHVIGAAGRSFLIANSESGISLLAELSADDGAAARQLTSGQLTTGSVSTSPALLLAADTTPPDVLDPIPSPAPAQRRYSGRSDLDRPYKSLLDFLHRRPSQPDRIEQMAPDCAYSDELSTEMPGAIVAASSADHDFTAELQRQASWPADAADEEAAVPQVPLAPRQIRGFSIRAGRRAHIAHDATAAENSRALPAVQTAPNVRRGQSETQTIRSLSPHVPATALAAVAQDWEQTGIVGATGTDGVGLLRVSSRLGSVNAPPSPAKSESSAPVGISPNSTSARLHSRPSVHSSTRSVMTGLRGSTGSRGTGSHSTGSRSIDAGAPHSMDAGAPDIPPHLTKDELIARTMAAIQAQALQAPLQMTSTPASPSTPTSLQTTSHPVAQTPQAIGPATSALASRTLQTSVAATQATPVPAITQPVGGTALRDARDVRDVVAIRPEARHGR